MKRLTLLLLLTVGLLTFVVFCSSDAGTALRVNVMPSGISSGIYQNAYAWPGKTLTIWGNVQDGASPYQYTWDFGDGTPVVSGAVANPKYIAVTHSYATMGPKIASLTVTDNLGATDNDQVRIEVVNMSDPCDPQVNAAIENGLRYLYLTQQGDGYWPNNSGYPVSATGMAVLAFENAAHWPGNDVNDDIYAETVQKGLQYIFNHGYTKAIGPQAHGDPDTDGDGKGIYFNSYTFPSHESYETGIVMMAIVGSRDSSRVAASTSSADINGRTYAEIMRDAVDWCAWAQEENSVWRGGWRYQPNMGTSDNSVTQWPVIGLEAAETEWGIDAPAFVKSELTLWVNYSQNANGGFGYTSPNEWVNVAKTGAGLCLMSYAGIDTSATKFLNACSFIAANWYSMDYTYGNLGDFYAMYGVAKGCRISVPDKKTFIGTHKWSDEYNDWLAKQGRQLADGSWPINLAPYVDQYLGTALGVLILTPAIIEWGPIAKINAPDAVPPDIPFPMDARNSYHRDLSKRVVEWLWDFDNSDGVDWNHPDAAGLDVINPGYSLLGGVPSASFTITLRVADNSDSVMTDTDEHVITVNVQNHPPIADAGGPYSARINQIITFDGTGSFDLDPGDYIASYSWDLNGDGIFGDCTDPVCTNSWDHIYSGQVGLIVTDSHGAVSDTGKGYVTVWTSLFDAWLTAGEIRFSPECPGSGQLVTIAAAIHCDAASDPMDALPVRFYDGNPDSVEKQIGADQVITNLAPGGSYPVQVVWNLPDSLMHEIYVRIDPDQEIEEFNEDNNEAHKTLWCPYINACIDIDPNTLNLKSKGQWITCYIEFCDPIGYDVANIDISSVKLNGVVPAEPRPSAIGDYDSDGIRDLMVKFDRAAVQRVLAVPRRHVAITVTGKVGAYEFRGVDYIDVINPPVLPGDETPSVDVVSLDTYPNPFNPSVRIAYGVPSHARVLVQIWSIDGRLVRTVEDAERSTGMYTAEWNGKDQAGRDVSSGLYFCKLTVGKEVLTKKLTLLK